MKAVRLSQFRTIIPAHQDPKPHILEEARRDSVQHNERLDCEEMEPGTFIVADPAGRDLFFDFTDMKETKSLKAEMATMKTTQTEMVEEFVGVQRELVAVQRELLSVHKKVATTEEELTTTRGALRTVEGEIRGMKVENGQYHKSTMLIRRGIFESFFKERGEQWSRSVIQERNQTAHGGDIELDNILMDTLIEDVERGRARRGELSQYTESFRKLHGIRHTDFASFRGFPEVVEVLDLRATARLRSFPEKANLIREVVDDVTTRFKDLESWQARQELKDGLLRRMIASVWDENARKP